MMGIIERSLDIINCEPKHVDAQVRKVFGGFGEISHILRWASASGKHHAFLVFKDQSSVPDALARAIKPQEWRLSRVNPDLKDRISNLILKGQQTGIAPPPPPPSTTPPPSMNSFREPHLNRRLGGDSWIASPPPSDGPSHRPSIASSSTTQQSANPPPSENGYGVWPPGFITPNQHTARDEPPQSPSWHPYQSPRHFSPRSPEPRPPPPASINGRRSPKGPSSPEIARSKYDPPPSIQDGGPRNRRNTLRSVRTPSPPPRGMRSPRSPVYDRRRIETSRFSNSASDYRDPRDRQPPLDSKRGFSYRYDAREERGRGRPLSRSRRSLSPLPPRLMRSRSPPPWPRYSDNRRSRSRSRSPARSPPRQNRVPHRLPRRPSSPTKSPSTVHTQILPPLSIPFDHSAPMPSPATLLSTVQSAQTSLPPGSADLSANFSPSSTAKDTTPTAHPLKKRDLSPSWGEVRDKSKLELAPPTDPEPFIKHFIDAQEPVDWWITLAVNYLDHDNLDQAELVASSGVADLSARPDPAPASAKPLLLFLANLHTTRAKRALNLATANGHLLAAAECIDKAQALKSVDDPIDGLATLKRHLLDVKEGPLGASSTIGPSSLPPSSLGSSSPDDSSPPTTTMTEFSLGHRLAESRAAQRLLESQLLAEKAVRDAMGARVSTLETALRTAKEEVEKLKITAQANAGAASRTHEQEHNALLKLEAEHNRTLESIKLLEADKARLLAVISDERALKRKAEDAELLERNVRRKLEDKLWTVGGPGVV